MISPKMRKLLSIDGGGVRGLAAIVVLEQLMDVANEERRKKSLEPQEPWQMFDMIAGSSTGGLIAVMLGRLRMSLKDCKEAYIKLSESVFTPRNLIQRAVGWGKFGPKFETGPLEDAIQDILSDHLKVGEKEVLLLEKDAAQCKVFVVTHLENITEPEILRSYRNNLKPTQQLDTVKIWQACRATSAAITFFEPMVVGDSRYSDGGLFYNNPVTQLNAEGMEMFPGDDILIVSLGTGIGSSKDFDPNVTTIASILADVATQTTRVANDFYRTARKNRYYRFDVPEIGDIGLEEYRELGRIKKLTDKYLNIPEVGEKLRICAERLAEVINVNEDLVTEIRGTLRSYAHNPRRDKIDRSHQKTFEWVWKNDETRFVEWLKSGWEVYWISGRLGAGKSTLMRYVLDDERLKQHFPPQHDGQTIICKYFFSELSGLATKQEKSLSGFLHSFLDQLLENIPGLIPLVWPIYINKVREQDSSENPSSIWSEVILKGLIGLIMEKADLAYNVILFIDGLDECEGDHKEQLQQLQSWMKPVQNRKFRTKLCIASRDLPEFEHHLRHCPGLKIHEWTAPDIKIYVEDELHNAFSLVDNRYAPDQATIKSELVEAVVKNARGVFLWVKLAVSDLVIGIEDSRYYTELKHQLDKVPSELDEVYGHLIEKIRPEYLHDAFEYFQVLLNAPGNTYTLTLLQISVATRDPREAIECCCQYEALDARNSSSRRVTRSSTSSQRYEKINLKEMETRIRSHCRGLIQIQARKKAEIRWDKTRKDNVGFIHRTAVKYIQNPEVIEGIKKRLSQEGKLSLRNPYVLIMASYLRLLKTHPYYLPPWDLQDAALENFKKRQKEEYEDLIVPDESSRNPVTWDDDGDEFDEKDYQEEKASNNASNAITCFLNYAERAEVSTKSAQTAYVDELNRVMSLTHRNWASIFFEERIGHWFYQGDILCLAICWKLKLYVREKLDRNDIHSNRARPLFWYAMNPPGWRYDSVDSETLRLIIGNEAQRDETYEYHNHQRIGVLEHVVRQVLGLDTNHLSKGWHKVLKIMLFEKVQLYRLNEVFRSVAGRERTIQHLLVQYIEKPGNDQDAEIKKCLEWLFVYGADARTRNSEGLNVLEAAKQRGPKAEHIVEEAMHLAKRNSRKRLRSPALPVAGGSANQRSLGPRTGPP